MSYNNDCYEAVHNQPHDEPFQKKVPLATHARSDVGVRESRPSFSMPAESLLRNGREFPHLLTPLQKKFLQSLNNWQLRLGLAIAFR